MRCIFKGLLLPLVCLIPATVYSQSLLLSVSAEIDQNRFPNYYSVAGENGGPIIEGGVSLGKGNFLYTNKNIRFTVLEHSPNGSSTKVMDEFKVKLENVSASYIKQVSGTNITDESVDSKPTIESIEKSESIIDVYVDNEKINKESYTNVRRIGEAYNSFSVRSNSPIPAPSTKPSLNTIETNIEVYVSVLISPLII